MAGVLGVREPERLPAFLRCWWIVRMRLITRTAMPGSDGGREFCYYALGDLTGSKFLGKKTWRGMG